MNTKRNVFDDNIDFKSLFRKFTSKWYYFIITLLAALTLAVIYYKLSNKYYDVEATLQLNENTYNYSSKEELTVLSDLMKKQTIIEDEIGMLSSYEIVGRTIRQLDFTISYFQRQNFLGISSSTEVYSHGFKILPDAEYPQPIYLPIYLEFLGNDKVRISTEGEEIYLYDMVTKEKSARSVPEIQFEKEQSVFAPVTSEYLNFEILLDSMATFEEGDRYFFVINTEDNLIDNYRDKLRVSRLSEESNIIKLATTGSVVEKEQLFINTLMNTFIDNDLQKKNQFGLKAIEFIDTQLSKVSDSLENVEGVIETFRTDKNIMDIGVTTESLTGRVNQLEARRAELSIQNEYYKNIARSLLKGNDLNDIVAPSSVGIEDPLLKSLLLELSQLQQQKVSVSYSSSKNNPVLKLLNDKIANTRASLQENVDNLINSSKATLNQIEREMRTYQARLNELPQNERNLVDLQRKFTHNDNVYNFLLQKRAEAGIAVASNVADKSIIDEARMAGDGPAYPNLMKILVMAMLASLLLPVGLIMAKDFFNDKINSKDDLQHISDIPILESIVRAEYNGNKNVVKNRLMVDESFKFARVNLQYLYGNTTCKVIGVTSSIAGEGKTFCSSYLSSSFARSGKRTLLVCGDLHRPRIKEYHKIKDQPGLAEYLSQKNSLEEVIQHTEIHSLDIIAPGNIVYEPSSLLEQPRMHDLFSAIRSKYTYVVVETPPVGYVADYLLIAKYFDINLLVVRHNYTDKKVLASTEELLKENQIKNLNILFNGVKTNDDAQYKHRKKVYSYRNAR